MSQRASPDGSFFSGCASCDASDETFINARLLQNAILLQIVYFYQSNTNGVIHTAHDHGVIACWQLCDDCRLPAVRWRQPTGSNIAHLFGRDDPADYRGPPVIIASD